MIDHLVIGGGFYGCCLAVFLRRAGGRVVLLEAEAEILTRASRVNQARIHTGFHYPRSALTAVKSMVLHRRFAEDFPEAVVDSFDMLYAIARNHSKVSAGRFWRMFQQMGAPIAPASSAQAALFDGRMVEQVFTCTEFAFDYRALRRTMQERMEAAGVEVHLGTRVTAVKEDDRGVTVETGSGATFRAGQVFNVTYSGINRMLGLAGLSPASLKHEITEIVLIEPPADIAAHGITLMDGPFFSAMPYPARSLHSLTHVRYTPHRSWIDGDGGISAPEPAAPGLSHAAFMVRDAARYLPCMAEARIRESLYETKTVLIKNEADDGRPILYQRRPQTSRIVSILGGKIDNVYDLYELVGKEIPACAA